MSHLRLSGLASSASAPPRNAAATRAFSRFGFAPVCRPPPRAISGGLAMVGAHNEKPDVRSGLFDGL